MAFCKYKKYCFIYCSGTLDCFDQPLPIEMVFCVKYYATC